MAIPQDSIGISQKLRIKKILHFISHNGHHIQNRKPEEQAQQLIPDISASGENKI